MGDQGADDKRIEHDKILDKSGDKRQRHRRPRSIEANTEKGPQIQDTKECKEKTCEKKNDPEQFSRLRNTAKRVFDKSRFLIPLHKQPF